MSGLEQAIRTALESTDREDANQRARIYQSARQALEGGLAKQGITDSKAVARQRHRLDEIITAIEREEAEAARKAREARSPRPVVFDDPFAVGRVPESPAAPEPDAPQEPSFEDARPAEPQIGDFGLRAEPEAHFDYPESPVVSPERRETDFTEADFSVSTQDSTESGHLDSGELSAIDDLAVAAEERRPGGGTLKASGKKRPKKNRKAHRAERSERPPRKRGRFARLLIFVIVLAFLVFGGWWVVSSNFALDPDSLDTAVPNPAPRIEAEDFEGASGWTGLFQPGAETGFAAGSAVQVDNVTVDGVPAVQIAAQAGGDAGAVSINLPPAVREMLESGPVLIEASVLAPDGGGQSVGIYCADGTIDGCQRHRFTPSAHRESLVIRLDPSQGGVLPTQMMISSDLTGGGAPLDIFAIRARAAD
ncbi:hypothetical protein [Martelella mangrovi]|uniref:Biotin transporter BioY n=1 Tax=Martelella mangrovi TaxID=1397477 RepID=A0ABV2IAI8_9HYPH